MLYSHSGSMTDLLLRWWNKRDRHAHWASATLLKGLYSEKFHISDFWFHTLYREWLAKFRFFQNSKYKESYWLLKFVARDFTSRIHFLCSYFTHVRKANIWYSFMFFSFPMKSDETSIFWDSKMITIALPHRSFAFAS